MRGPALHLAELEAHAVHLDLAVLSADEAQRALAARRARPPRHVARQVDALAAERGHLRTCTCNARAST